MGAGVFLPPLPVSRMLRRCLATAGLPEILSSHSFRVLVVTGPHRFNGCTQMAVHACLVRQSYRQKHRLDSAMTEQVFGYFQHGPREGGIGRRRMRTLISCVSHFPLVLGGLRGVPKVALSATRTRPHVAGGITFRSREFLRERCFCEVAEGCSPRRPLCQLALCYEVSQSSGESTLL